MSNNLPIYIISIMKNEAKHIERWYNSFKDEMEPGDMAVLLDTGSDDGSYEFAESLGITVYKKVYEKWRFDTARNDLREMLPQDDAWLLSLDVDEVLIDGWRGHVDSAPTDVNRLRYKYTWSWKEDGTPGVTYHGDKIVRRHSHTWTRNGT